MVGLHKFIQMDAGTVTGVAGQDKQHEVCVYAKDNHQQLERERKRGREGGGGWGGRGGGKGGGGERGGERKGGVERERERERENSNSSFFLIIMQSHSS